MRTVLGTLVGAGLGFLLGWAAYALAAPVLEESSGFVRELQGLLWNLVPGLTVLGAWLGWWRTRRL